MIKLYDYAKLHFVKASAILNIGETFQQLVTMTTPVLEAGVYMISFSWEADFNDQKNQPFETQITGDFAGNIYSDSIGDNDVNIKTRYYAFPVELPGGPVTIGVQGRKSAAFISQLNVDFIDIMVYRVG